MTQEEARRLTRSIRGAKEEMEQNLLLSEGDALLVRYRNREGPSCSMQLYEALRALELNYKPKRLVAPETFKRVFEELWKRFDQGEEREELLLLMVPCSAIPPTTCCEITARARRKSRARCCAWLGRLKASASLCSIWIRWR